MDWSGREKVRVQIMSSTSHSVTSASEPPVASSLGWGTGSSGKGSRGRKRGVMRENAYKGEEGLEKWRSRARQFQWMVNKGS